MSVVGNASQLAAKLLIILGLPLIVAFFTYKFMQESFILPVSEEKRDTVLFEIAPGTGFKQVASQLEAKGLVRNGWALDILSRVKGIDRKINSGEYSLSSSMSPREIIEKLVKGEVFQRRITLREGASIWAIPDLVEQAGLFSSSLTREQLTTALTDPSLLARAGILADSFEGYLFPETYSYSRPTDATGIIWAMLKEGEKNWPAEFSDAADKLGLSRHEVLTLASIIEKESGNVEEQPIISSVFHNRLKQGMRLQSDPTVIYGIPDFNGNITKQDLETDSPYNTYTRAGLPPGPICNPGRSAIEAALKPAETQFLFFVGDGRGKHVFSTTLKEHNDAVRKYQLGG